MGAVAVGLDISRASTRVAASQDGTAPQIISSGLFS